MEIKVIKLSLKQRILMEMRWLYGKLELIFYKSLLKVLASIDKKLDSK